MKKVLIVEDDVALQKVYATELKLKGYQVVTVSDGMTAFDTVRTEMPDFILLDLMLPGRNGLEILQEIKEDEELMGIKVVMLTNYGDEENVKKALDYGAEDYMLKYNIVPSELSEKVALVLGDSSDSVVNLTNI